MWLFGASLSFEDLSFLTKKNKILWYAAYHQRKNKKTHLVEVVGDLMYFLFPNVLV